MTSQIKIFFLVLFIINVIAGFSVSLFYNILAGIIAFALLLLLNAVGYAIILKMSKITQRKDNAETGNNTQPK